MFFQLCIFATALLAMFFFQLCTFVTAVLGMFLIWTENDVEKGQSVWSLCYNFALIAIRAVVMFVWYGRSVTFFKDTIFLGEQTTRIGATIVSVVFALVCSFEIEYVMTRIQKVQSEVTEDDPEDRDIEILFIFLEPLFDELFVFHFYVGIRDYVARIAPPLVMICYFFLHHMFLPPSVSETGEVQ